VSALGFMSPAEYERSARMQFGLRPMDLRTCRSPRLSPVGDLRLATRIPSLNASWRDSSKRQAAKGSIPLGFFLPWELHPIEMTTFDVFVRRLGYDSRIRVTRRHRVAAGALRPVLA